MQIEKKIIQCKNYPITYTLFIKQVKNINMRISPGGEVHVSANAFVPIDKIDDFVTQKITWIVAHQKHAEQHSAQITISESHIRLFGNKLKIKHTKGKFNHVSYDDQYLYVQLKEGSQAEKVINLFLNKLCKDVFTDVALMTQKTLADYHLSYPQIKIRNMKSRWGSCTPAKNSITLNKKLIHYPFEFIEYVVLHEFVHFIQPNHSSSFYHIIQNHMPDYKERMKLAD